ncbi:hypothetical protein HID58_088004 [Brassica napus]|uniref:DET1- and DDB1-associated protein 1 n=1 Tax=Brassica napus TaxID=3708 RepID=A0ABQ7XUY5_BRANA|nr:hypothetical protein HID58_088004 [Brassica napus]
MADEAVSLFKCFYERNPYILAPKPHRPVVQRERGLSLLEANMLHPKHLYTRLSWRSQSQATNKHTSVQNACIVDIYNEKKDGKLNKGNNGGRIHIEAEDNRKTEDFRSSGHPAPPHVTHYFRRWWWWCNREEEMMVCFFAGLVVVVV